jgi:hypothetical protein
MMVAGGGGVGVHDASWRRCMKESVGKSGSVLYEKSWRGLVPVEEKRETRGGCGDDANIDMHDTRGLNKIQKCCDGMYL